MGEHRLELGGPRQLTLFASLILQANRGVTSDVLVDAVWGHRQSRSDNRLAMAVARLRKALRPLNRSGESPVRTVSAGYLLSVGPGELDAEVFSAGVRAGRRALDAGDPARAASLLGAALRLWRGPPLAEVCFKDFAQAEIRQLEELRLVARETRVEAELQLGRHAQLIGELEAMLASQPTRERVASQLMLALYRSGRQAEALEVYQRTRIHLAAALGLQPGPALRALQLQILHQSYSLQQTFTTRRDSSANPPHRNDGRASRYPRPDRQCTSAWPGFSSHTLSNQTVSVQLRDDHSQRRSPPLLA